MKGRDFVYGLLAATLFSTVLLSAQEITMNWPDRSITSAPTEIHKGDVVKVTVSNVNDILYDYKVNVSLQIGSGDDLALVAKFLVPGGGAAAARTATPTCPEALANAKADLKAITTDITAENNLVPNATTPIPLTASLAGWKKATLTDGRLANLDSDVANVKNLCPGNQSNDFLAGAYAQFDKVRKKAEGSHAVQAQSVASSGEVSAVTIDITESYTDSSGKTQTVTVYHKTLSFSPVLSLSGGVLFSTLRQPTYVRQTVPGSTNSVLGVDGGGVPVPYIIGLLNYRVPRLDWPKVGFALSTGPVLRVGGSSTATSFGYFNGLSVTFWHRLYVTGGSHVGQFPDTPAGFAVGQSIPSTFTGQLTPVHRWTARFAIAVTYKTNDLGALSSQTKTTTTPAKTTTGAAGGGSTPQ